jgi:hypothetical protein
MFRIMYYSKDSGELVCWYSSHNERQIDTMMNTIHPGITQKKVRVS